MFSSLEAVIKAAKKIQLSSRAGHVLRLTAVASLLAAVSVSAQAPLDVRVALIIGNSAYAGKMALLNPANDAKDMADVLKRLGFNVIELRDGNKAQMAAAIAKVSDSLKGKQGVGMFYYAGHGLQLDWRNYMVPVDANVQTPGDVLQQTIDMGSVIDIFKASGNRMSILVLDACRNNPFGATTSTGKGLAQLDAPPSTFLAYATAPGNVAEDGDEKSGNGLYTQFLLQELKRPTARIEDVFKRVRLNVRKQSNGRQIPWESTSLEDDFFFNDGVKYTIKPEDLERMAASMLAGVAEKDLAAVTALQKEIQRISASIKAPDARLNKEQAAARLFDDAKANWEVIKTSTNPEDFYGFLALYPSVSEFAEPAQYRLDQLAKPKVIASLGKGQGLSFAYKGPRFKVGDNFQYQVSDLLTKVPGGKINLSVSEIKNDMVKFGNVDVLMTMLSSTVKNAGNQFEPLSGGLPAELQVGKKWSNSSTFLPPRGDVLPVKIESKITSVEFVTVPAGTFQAYVVESFVGGGYFSIKQKLWIDPRYGLPLKSEQIGHHKSKIFLSDKRELIAVTADRS